MEKLAWFVFLVMLGVGAAYAQTSTDNPDITSPRASAKKHHHKHYKHGKHHKNPHQGHLATDRYPRS
jgi:hypothetical protein